MTPFGAIDSPLADELVFSHGFQLRGWAELGDGRRWKGVAVKFGEHIFGATALPIGRPDVAEGHGLDHSWSGFMLRCQIPEHLRSLESLALECYVVDEEDRWHLFCTHTVRPSPIDYRIHGHGYMLTDARADDVLVRDRVYGSGPPSPHADGSVADLIMNYLQPGETVLDVGCGIGAYYRALTPRGIHWSGCETRADFVELLQSEGLPATLVRDGLPYGDKEFDATICIEVLEHVADYEPFVAEVARVSRRAGVFSVPNFGAIPVTASRYAVPWHMLESDHKNFFTVRNLAALLSRYYRHVETFEYGPLTYLQSIDGIAINNHVFAVCQH